MATKKPSAPVLMATRPPIASINSVHARPSPATKRGCVRIALTSRTAARDAGSERSSAEANHAIAFAMSLSRAAKLGAEHPSIPNPGLSDPVVISKASSTAFCTGCSGAIYSGPAFRCFANVKKPECFPEQLLCH